jgi:hypothetical protein
MRITPRRGLAAGLMLALTTGLVAAPAALAADPVMPLAVSFVTQSDAAQNHVHVVGAEADRSYGTIRLTGSFDIEGTPIPVEVVGTSLYQDGTGPFTGAMTLTYPNGDELGLRFDAVVQPSGEGTAVAGSLQVIGGTGVLAGVTGSATMTGGRVGPLGSPVEYAVTFDLVGLPDPASVAPAEPPASAGVTTDPDATGIDLMTYYSDLLVAQDVPALQAFLGDGFMIQRADGSFQQKADYIGKLPDLTAFAFSEQVETRADDLIVLRMLAAAELKIDGKTYKPDPAPMLAVFEWNDDAWQLVAQGNFNLPQS